MQITEQCYELVRTFEGCRLQAYQCPAGVWTIGYGHTGKVDGQPIGPGMQITRSKAEALLKQDLRLFTQLVMGYDGVYNWNQNELDALVSFAFNVGNIHQLTANGTRSKAVIAQKMLLYNKAGGVVLKGLENRRKAEAALFTQPVEPLVQSLNLQVHGEAVTIPAVLIQGHNYVKLRDFCKCLQLNISFINNMPVVD